MSTSRTTLWFMLTLLTASFAACAEGSLNVESDSETDSESDGQVGDADDDAADTDEADSADDLEDDTANNDTAVDTADAAQDQGEDDLVGECTPFSIACTDDNAAIQRCSVSGELFDPSPCPIDQNCSDEGDTVECIDCLPGLNCRDEIPECEPETNFCLNFQTAAQCTDTGGLGTQVGCGAGRCYGGGCSTTGSDTGEACTEDNGLNGCLGRHCLCGTEDVANDGTALCTGNMGAGYCTTDGCIQNGCDSTSEVCADFTLSGAFGGDDICVLREECTTRLGPCAGGHRGDDHLCRYLPRTDRNGSRSWSLGCWSPPPSDNGTCSDNDCISPIGGACSSNIDCIGGVCLNEDGVSYCAAACGDSLGCPDNAACVVVNETPLCVALANRTHCPRIISDSFDITSRSLPRHASDSTAQVCFFN